MDALSKNCSHYLTPYGTLTIPDELNLAIIINRQGSSLNSNQCLAVNLGVKYKHDTVKVFIQDVYIDQEVG